MESTDKSLKENKMRDSKFELLRILSMMSIFIYHYINYGGILNVGSYTNNKLIALFLYSGGRVGVNIFILIMGFFMINSKFKIKKVLKMTFQVFFYSILLAVIAVHRLQSNFKVISINEFFTPILSSLYWFATYYIIVYLVSPFINKLIKSLGKEGCKKFIISATVILSVIPTISYRVTFATEFFTWFVFMYIIGAYIKEYNFEFKNPKTALIITICYPIVAFFTVIVSILINKYTSLNVDITHFHGLYCILTLIGSIGIFMLFKNLHIKGNKIINFFGKTSFAVYLLHDHLLYRNILWSMDLKTQLVEQSPAYIFVGHLFVSMIIIYLIASFIEFLRVTLLEKRLFKIKVFDKYFDRFDNWYNEI